MQISFSKTVFKTTTLFAEKRLIMMRRRAESPNAPVNTEETPENEVTRENLSKNREFHEKIMDDIAKIPLNSCRQIIRDTKKVLKRLEGVKGFEDLYEDFNKKLNEGRKLLNSTGAKIIRANRSEKYINSLVKQINQHMDVYIDRVNKFFPQAGSRNTDNKDMVDMSGKQSQELRQSSKEQPPTGKNKEKNGINNKYENIQANVKKIVIMAEDFVEKNIDMENLKKDVVVDIPGKSKGEDYKLSIIKWGNPENRPNFMISKGADLVCYKDPKKGWIQPSEKLNDTNRKKAEIAMVLNAGLESTYEVTPPKKENPHGITITNKADFIKSMEKLINYSNNHEWSQAMPSYHVQREGNFITISPKGALCKIRFDKNNPENLELIYRADLKSLVGERTQRPQTQPEQTQPEQAQPEQAQPEQAQPEQAPEVNVGVDEKVAEQSKEWFKQREQKIKNLEKQRELKNKKNIIGRMIAPKFKDFVEISEENPFEFKINAKNKAQKKLVRTTKIHEFLDIANNIPQACLVIIDGDRGPRRGLYYPVQETVYMLGSDGKQTNERVKFYNGDTINLERVDDEEYRKKLNDSDNEGVLKLDRIKTGRLIAEFILLYKEFESKDIDKKNIDLSRLDKYKQKYDFYKPENIFKRFTNDSNGYRYRNLREPIQEGKITYAKANEIIQDEIAIIKDALLPKDLLHPFDD